MKLVFWSVVALVAAVLALFAMSNREAVALGLWPLPFELDLPLYLAILAALLIGFMAGGLVAPCAAARLRCGAPMQLITGDEIHRLLDFPSLIDALRAMFRDGCEAPARHHHAISA